MPATIGDNSKMLTPAEERALFHYHYNLIAAARAIVNQAKAEEKRLRKIAKADAVYMRDIDFAMRCDEVEDQSIIVGDLVRHVQIAIWRGLPIGAQPELNFEREPGVDRARREGTAAGLSAKPRQPPYAVDSEQGQEWLNSYDAGQAEVQQNFLTAMEKRNAERAAQSAKAKRGNGRDAAETDAEYVENEDEDETEDA